MNENQIKEEANKAFGWLIKYLEDYAEKKQTANPDIRFIQGLASGMRHAAKMANIQLEYFNQITNLS